MSTKRTWARAAAALLALGLVAAACGDDGGSKGSESTGSTGSTGKTGASASTTTATPKKGGTLTVAMYSETRGLDPVIGSGSGTAGGTEMAALFDTIVRWNPDTRKY